MSLPKSKKGKRKGKEKVKIKTRKKFSILRKLALYTVLRPRNNGYFQVRSNQSPEMKPLSSHRRETKYQVAKGRKVD